MDPVLTPAAEHLDIDGRTLAPHPETGDRVFQDEEVFVRLPGVDGLDRAAVIHAGMPEPNTGLVRLHGILALLREHRIDVELALTYPPYGRQDAEFFPGTCVHARELLRTAVERFDVERVHAVDPHFAARDWVEGFPVEIHRAFPLLADAANLDDPVVVGPDRGAVERFGVPSFRKERHGADVEVEGDPDVAGREVLLFDDIIATGSTMVAAAEELRAEGAERVVAAAVHGVMGDGLDRVADAVDALHVTDTVRNDHADVRVSGLLRDALNL